MATQIQTQANRRSAQLSTGSRTQPGKAISRINALKTGIDARNEAASGEDPADLAHRHIVDTMPSFFNHLGELERRRALRRQHQSGVDSSVTDSPETENPEIGFVPHTTPNPAGPASAVDQHTAQHDPTTAPAITRSPQTPSSGFGFVPHTTVPPHHRPRLLPSVPSAPNGRSWNRTATVKLLAYGVLGDSIP